MTQSTLNPASSHNPSRSTRAVHLSYSKSLQRPLHFPSPFCCSCPERRGRETAALGRALEQTPHGSGHTWRAVRTASLRCPSWPSSWPSARSPGSAPVTVPAVLCFGALAFLVFLKPRKRSPPDVLVFPLSGTSLPQILTASFPHCRSELKTAPSPSALFPSHCFPCAALAAAGPTFLRYSFRSTRFGLCIDHLSPH